MSSNTKSETEDHEIVLQKNAPLPQAGYDLIFDEELAQQIAEFVHGDLYKKLKRVYMLQRAGIIARACLNGANDATQLHYYKGMAASVKFFFTDMEKVTKAVNKDEDPTDNKE